jgi:hypothetical protein
MKKIELLNAEGCILSAEKVDKCYLIKDQWKNKITILSEKQIQEFVHGDLEITDSKNRVFKYSELPGSMKPDLKELDEFIGIPTEGKTY